MKKSLQYISVILVIGLGIYGCAKDDPPPPGQNTWYPGTNPNLPTQPGQTGTWTFWVDQDSCGFMSSVYIELYSYTDSLFYTATTSSTYGYNINCLNSNLSGARFDLPPGYYSVYAQDNGSGISWTNITLFVSSGECRTFQLWCH